MFVKPSDEQITYLHTFVGHVPFVISWSLLIVFQNWANRIYFYFYFTKSCIFKLCRSTYCVKFIISFIVIKFANIYDGNARSLRQTGYRDFQFEARRPGYDPPIFLWSFWFLQAQPGYRNRYNLIHCEHKKLYAFWKKVPDQTAVQICGKV